MITNRKSQEQLDLIKYKQSELVGYDMSGFMPYCEKCEHRVFIPESDILSCDVTQDERKNLCLCAKAFNK